MIRGNGGNTVSELRGGPVWFFTRHRGMGFTSFALSRSSAVPPMECRGLSSIKVDKRGPPRESKERPAPRRSPDGTFKRRKSNQL